MSANTCTNEQFLKDVCDHQMIVIRADGVVRHIRFKKPGASYYWFDLITWPGALCIDGDCGTYVFKRLEDMFVFFRTKHGGINDGYWAEKVVAQCKTDGLTEFDRESFVRQAVETYRDYWRDRREWSRQLEGFRELRDEVLNAENLYEAHAAMRDFGFEGFEFHDTWEWDLTRYTGRFIWNLRAIAWGIQQWDSQQQQQEQAA